MWKWEEGKRRMDFYNIFLDGFIFYRIATPCLEFGEGRIIVGTRKWVMGVTCTPRSSVVSPPTIIVIKNIIKHINQLKLKI